MRGQLYVIGTPIGNLSDLSPRARETLTHLDVLFCEDTRVSGKLLSFLGLSVPLRSLSDDHAEGRVRQAIEALNAGRRVGFASDAGMPGISDPGRRLVRAAWEAGYKPIVVPGGSSVGTLLAACPFIDNRFRFVGFPPRKDGDRARFAALLAGSAEPCFFFESPHRVHAVLDEICTVVEPQRELILGREMTKLHEQLELFTAADWPALRDSVPTIGEFTVAVAAAPAQEAPHDEAQLAAALKRLQEAGFTKRDAVKALAAVWEVSPNELKDLAY